MKSYMAMVKKMRESFIFYRSFWECVSELPESERLEVYESIFRFALNGEEPENISGISLALFKAFKPQILANYRKYENGCKGGRSKTKPNTNQNETKTKANESKHKRNDNDNVNDNVNGNGNGNVSGSDERNTDELSSLLSFLNSETGASYSETEQFDDLINELFNKGYSVDDIKTVIRKKSMEWSCDGKMRTNLRPSVLFGDKFEEYLNAPEPIEVEERKQKTEKTEGLKRDLEQKSDELFELNSEIERIRKNDDIKVDYDSFNAMKLRAAILEQEIDSINTRLGGAT